MNSETFSVWKLSLSTEGRCLDGDVDTAVRSDHILPEAFSTLGNWVPAFV